MMIIPIVMVVALLSLLVGIAIGRSLLIRKNLGEGLVANTIANHFQRPHVLLNNVTFEVEDRTTQIDHLLIADTGIFVIETKHYKGWIFGHPNGSQWTQTIYKYKSKFQNPLRQNYGHLRTVQSLFNLPEAAYFPIIVFSGDSELKSDFGPTVLRLGDLVEYLSADRPVIFDERKMAYIVGRIEMKRIRRSVETDEYHLNSIRQRIQER